jgi:crotonobetainyl-CoA:carnitine CoA-transferase CaiB-like acyl-CoA transferase
MRCIDLTSNMSGPLATMVLAEQGADVIKVEPLGGDLIRTVGTGRGGMSAYFANLNRGKRSVAIDLTAEAASGLVRRLASTADAFVQNFRPGVVERLGLGAEGLMAANRRLVYASISGFGREGPLAVAPAYDHVVQAISGIAALQAAPDGTPSLVHQGLVDKATAYTLAQAITAALLARATTGVGCQVDVSMLDVALAFVWPDGMMNHTCLDPAHTLPPVSRSFRVTPTADGTVVLVTLTPTQWDNLAAALLDSADSADGGLSGTAERMSGGAAVMREVRRQVATMTTAEVIERLSAADVPCAPVLPLDAVPTHDQVVASGAVTTLDHPTLGPVRQPLPAPRFDGSRPPIGAPAPRVGEHTDDVLAELGLGNDEIEQLRAARVVALPTDR